VHYKEIFLTPTFFYGMENIFVLSPNIRLLFGKLRPVSLGVQTPARTQAGRGFWGEPAVRLCRCAPLEFSCYDQTVLLMETLPETAEQAHREPVRLFFVSQAHCGVTLWRLLGETTCKEAGWVTDEPAWPLSFALPPRQVPQDLQTISTCRMRL
jgi:hypothetical protein